MDPIAFDFIGAVSNFDVILFYVCLLAAAITIVWKCGTVSDGLTTGGRWDRIASVALSCALGFTAVSVTNVATSNLEQNRADRESVGEALETLVPPDVYAANETAITAFAHTAPDWGFGDSLALELTSGLIEVKLPSSPSVFSSMGSGIITYSPDEELEPLER